MDLNRLRVLSAIHQTGSVTRAAQKLRVTPSAVSQALRALEADAGARLFQRHPRGLAPTPEADALHALHESFRAGVEACLGDWRQASKEPRGLLRIGAPPVFGSRQVVAAVARFSSFEAARFQIRFGAPEPLLAALADGSLDLMFCDFGAHLRRYRGVAVWNPVFRERSVLVCSPAFQAKFIGRDQSYRNLIRLAHVDYRDDAGIISLWYRHNFGKAPANLSLRLVAHDVHAMIEAAERGIGLAFVPAHLVETELKRKSLVVVATGKKDYVNPIQLVRLKDHVPTLLERRFVECFPPC